MMLEKAASSAREILANSIENDNVVLAIGKVEADANQMKNIALAAHEINEKAVVVLGGVFENKPALCLYIPQSLVDGRGWDAPAMIREAAKEIQGGGGGQKNFASAGGKNAAGLDKAIEILKNKILN